MKYRPHSWKLSSQYLDAYDIITNNAVDAYYAIRLLDASLSP